MLTEQEQQFNEILQDIATSLDISPSKYKQAVDHYKAVGDWLENGNYTGSNGTPNVYPQGSFRLGTVIRPLKDSKETDYDLDLVCQLAIKKENVTAADLKQMVGKEVKGYSDKNNVKLDEEGRRCWTLEYAEEDGVGFHMDILPSIPTSDVTLIMLNKINVSHQYSKYAIDITEKDKTHNTYSWKDGGSNPEGYAKWFDNRKICYPDYMGLSTRQKQAIYENTRDKNNRLIFASVNDVPEPLVRTPLQQSIQILKHHRDIYFRAIVKCCG
jgi:hypothetical protein